MESAGQQQVLITPELLELILLQLPLQDLLVAAQRVSRTWKDLIDFSPQIQEALFFRARLVSNGAAVPAASFRPSSFNPLLQSAFPPWFRSENKVCRGKRVLEALPWSSSPAHRDAFMCAGASWRKMLPCQPPKRVLEVVGKENSARGIFETNSSVGFDGNGIRMGTLYGLGFVSIRRYVSSFWMAWDEDGAPEDKLTVFKHYSYFKSGPGMPPDVGNEFLSEGHEDLEFDSVREEGRSRMWHQGFGNPPMGGYMLRQT